MRKIILHEDSAGLVLCYLPDNNTTPFVVWRRCGPYDFISGSYCKDIFDAVEAFKERSS